EIINFQDEPGFHRTVYALYCHLSNEIYLRSRPYRAYQSACSPTGRDSGLKSSTVPVRIRPGAPDAPIAVGCSNHPWPPAPQLPVASGRVAISVCAVRFRGGLQDV